MRDLIVLAALVGAAVVVGLVVATKLPQPRRRPTPAEVAAELLKSLDETPSPLEDDR